MIHTGAASRPLLSCKICSYICPTCRCFDVRDYTVEAGRDTRRSSACVAGTPAWLTDIGASPVGTTREPPKHSGCATASIASSTITRPISVQWLALAAALHRECPTNVDISEVLQEVAARGTSAVTSAD